MKLLKRSLAIISAIIMLVMIQVQPANASLKDCNFRGTNAQEYYKCSENISQFTLTGQDFIQPNGRGCVWTNKNAGYHFTSATGDSSLGDVHITMDGNNKHCGLDIVSPQTCQPTHSALDTCTQAELTDAIDTCERFLISGNCSF